jgi:DNA-binding transcriptional LysR family regulator
MMLDLESVRLFVLTIEYGSLTRAAKAAGTVQPVVSQRIKALETMLGRKLLERTPRILRLTEAGSVFLERARPLLATHDAALALEDRPPISVAIGVSDHTLGTSFAMVLRRMRAGLAANAAISVRLGQSQAIQEMFETGAVDLAILRREARGKGGEVLGEDPLGWHAPKEWIRQKGPLPLVTLPPPCGVRAIALKALARAKIPWRDAFTGGSCLALVTAVRAGLGVAPLGRIVSTGLPECGEALGLPPLPASRIVLLARTSQPHLSAAARILAVSVRESLR